MPPQQPTHNRQVLRWLNFCHKIQFPAFDGLQFVLAICICWLPVCSTPLPLLNFNFFPLHKSCRHGVAYLILCSFCDKQSTDGHHQVYHNSKNQHKNKPKCDFSPKVLNSAIPSKYCCKQCSECTHPHLPPQLVSLKTKIAFYFSSVLDYQLQR